MQLSLLLQHSCLPLQCHLISHCNTLLCHCNTTQSLESSPVAMQLGLPLQHSPLPLQCNTVPPATLVCHCNAIQSFLPPLPSPIAMSLGLLLPHSRLPLQCNLVSPSSTSIPRCNATQSPTATLVCHCNTTRSPILTPLFTIATLGTCSNEMRSPNEVKQPTLPLAAVMTICMQLVCIHCTISLCNDTTTISASI